MVVPEIDGIDLNKGSSFMNDQEDHSVETDADEHLESQDRVLAFTMARQLSHAEMLAVAGGLQCDTASPNCDAYA
jgi:hypothetical protein